MIQESSVDDVVVITRGEEMSRLINADELRKMAEEPTIYDINVTDVLSLIDDCPTAYDVEAVVRELEKQCDANAGGLYKEQIIEMVRGGRNE